MHRKWETPVAKEIIQETNGFDMSKLFVFMTSGEPGSFVIWALLAYAVWSAVFEGPWASDNGVSGGWDGDGGDGCD